MKHQKREGENTVFFFSVLKSGGKMLSIRSGLNVTDRMMSAKRSLKSKLWLHLFRVAAWTWQNFNQDRGQNQRNCKHLIMISCGGRARHLGIAAAPWSISRLLFPCYPSFLSSRRELLLDSTPDNPVIKMHPPQPLYKCQPIAHLHCYNFLLLCNNLNVQQFG